MAPRFEDHSSSPGRLTLEPRNVIQAYASVDPEVGSEFGPIAGFNCTGGSVEARRVSRGRYEVRWGGIELDPTQASIGAHAMPAQRSLTPIAGTSETNDLLITLIDRSGAQVDESFSVSYVAVA